jgi:hypothetical protein
MEAETQGGAWASQAGASEPDSLASELADSPVSESLISSAAGPALALDPRLSTPLWLPYPLSISRNFKQDLEKLSGTVHFYVVSAYFY